MSTARFGGAASLRGTLSVPGDKSISHRALLFAALAQGESRLTGLASGEDVAATRHALEALGVAITDEPDGWLRVAGAGFEGLAEAADVIDCGNSGTTMRVLVGVLAGRPFLSVLSGDQYLRRRPMARVCAPLRAMGAVIDGRHDGTLAPLAVRGQTLRGMRHDLAVASAQVKTALVLAGLQAQGRTEVHTPAPTRDHTERMLAAFGAPIEVDGTTVTVEPGPIGPCTFAVPGDPSSAAFFVVAACITPGSEVTIAGVSVNPSRIGFVEVLRRMGADVQVVERGEEAGEPFGDIVARHAPLRATVIEGDEIPNVIDEVPVLAVAAAFADGVTEIRNAEELAVKESNRITSVQSVLAGFGAAAEARPDGLVIRGGALHPATVTSHGDHRIAMASAVAAHALDGESTVDGWEAIGSSYPGFADDLASLVRRV